MFASNFTIRDSSLKYVRGEEKIKTFAMTKTIATGNTMTNYFCSVCGSLMYRGKLLRPSRRHKEKDDHCLTSMRALSLFRLLAPAVHTSSHSSPAVSSGWPGTAIMRIGQVDDLTLHGTRLKPQIEMFTKDRVSWFKGAEGAVQYRGNYYGGEEERDTQV